MLKLSKKILNELEEIETSMKYESDNKTILIRTMSPEGQDCVMEFELDETDNLTTLSNKIYNDYESFDVSEETSLWIDGTGHGINGAPYDIRDIVRDMEWRESWIKNVYEIIRLRSDV